MVKIFSFRLTPFFLFILSLQSLALLFSLYVGVLLYQDAVLMNTSTEIAERSAHSGLFLVVLLFILTPAFFYQTRTINHVKKTIREKMSGLATAVITMLLILFVNGSNLDARMFFVAALMSGCIGMLVGQFNFLGKYWRYLIRSGMN